MPETASVVVDDEGDVGGGDFISPERLEADAEGDAAVDDGDGEGDFLREGPHRR